MGVDRSRGFDGHFVVLSLYRMPLRLAFFLVSVFFLVVNVTCSLVVQIDTSVDAVKARHITLARVLINDSLFVLCAISLATCICKLAKMSSANVYLESKVRLWSEKTLKNTAKTSGITVFKNIKPKLIILYIYII